MRTALNRRTCWPPHSAARISSRSTPRCIPKDYTWHTTAGTEGAYNLGDGEKAKALLKKANYDGKPLRILTSRQYEFHYKMAQVAAEYLKQGGFAVELMVVDWATLTQRRTDPALWDIYITHSPFLPEPALTGILSESRARLVVDADAQEGRRRLQLRAAIRPSAPALWAEVQKAIYAEVPAIKIGDFNALSAQSPKVTGVVPAPWPYFWNASKA